MLSSNILKRKKVIDKLGNKINDLISSTFKFPEGSSGSNGSAFVNEFENMRPDLVSDRIYGKISNWDALLKHNAISNPFTIQAGDFLYAPSSTTIDSSYKKPKEISERDQKEESSPSPLLNPRTQKDKDRLKALEKKAGQVLPPNAKRKGESNVSKSGGKITFGGRGKVKSSNSISRGRLQAALLKNKISI